MNWSVFFHPDFIVELKDLPSDAKVNLVSTVNLLKEFGSTLGRPHVDTLNGSSFSNVKEIRFSTASGVCRVAFAFDPNRNAVTLVAGDKKGQKENRFYRDLISVADKGFANWLKELEEL